MLVTFSWPDSKIREKRATAKVYKIEGENQKRMKTYSGFYILIFRTKQEHRDIGSAFVRSETIASETTTRRRFHIVNQDSNTAFYGKNVFQLEKCKLLGK